MEKDKKSYIKNWLFRANEDFSVMQALHDIDLDSYTSSVCFHAQQASEKFLKAYLAYKDFDFPRTHDIDYLLMECQRFEPELFSIEVKSISDFGVSIRYPDDFYIPETEEAIEYRKITLKIKQAIESGIPLEIRE